MFCCPCPTQNNKLAHCLTPKKIKKKSLWSAHGFKYVWSFSPLQFSSSVKLKCPIFSLGELPYIGSWVLLTWPSSYSVTSLLSGLNKCSRLISDISFPRLGICHVFSKPWLLFLGMVFGDHFLGTRGALCFWIVHCFQASSMTRT